jgi:hypothetical protein
MEHAHSVPHRVRAAAMEPAHAPHVICPTVFTQLTACALFATSPTVPPVIQQIIPFAIPVLISIPSTTTHAPSIVLPTVSHAQTPPPVLSAMTITISIRLIPAHYVPSMPISPSAFTVIQAYPTSASPAQVVSQIVMEAAVLVPHIARHVTHQSGAIPLPISSKTDMFWFRLVPQPIFWHSVIPAAGNAVLIIPPSALPVPQATISVQLEEFALNALSLAIVCSAQHAILPRA